MIDLAPISLAKNSTIDLFKANCDKVLSNTDGPTKILSLLDRAIYLLNHFLSDKKLVESIEILADMFKIKNIEFLDMINKATILYNIFNDITLINNIIDSHYNRLIILILLN